MEKLFQLFYFSSGISTDTRKIHKDCLFICLSGTNFNGNTFAKKAIDLGAKFAIADDKLICDEEKIFFVENTLTFLQKLANYHRKKFNIPVIGITGSNGKTSTKELINTVLSKKFNTLCTYGNLNNHIGVPLTLLGLNEKHEIAIIEMGANKFKDIEELCLIAEPNYGIITNIGKAHLEGFINFEGVLKTKRELYEFVSLKNGMIFYNADDEILVNNLSKKVKKFSYSTINNTDITGELTNLNPYVNLKWKSKDFQSDEIQTSMIGKYNFYNFLAAISFGVYFKVDNQLICEAIKEYVPSNNRSQVLKTDKNTLLLDAYNANPSSMKSAIESFCLIEEKNKIAILGDMFELGEDSHEEHQRIVEQVKQQNLNTIFVGEKFYECQSNKNKYLSFFKNKQEVKNYFRTNQLNNAFIILKGSRGIGLEELVENL
jgi:UDP-N-acetylmuramoyl-tripeptide--D-alanyl-D-alanine ligase